jgi:hypothetical protein
MAVEKKSVAGYPAHVGPRPANRLARVFARQATTPIVKTIN